MASGAWNSGVDPAWQAGSDWSAGLVSGPGAADSPGLSLSAGDGPGRSDAPAHHNWFGATLTESGLGIDLTAGGPYGTGARPAAATNHAPLSPVTLGGTNPGALYAAPAAASNQQNAATVSSGGGVRLAAATYHPQYTWIGSKDGGDGTTFDEAANWLGQVNDPNTGHAVNPPGPNDIASVSGTSATGISLTGGGSAYDLAFSGGITLASGSFNAAYRASGYSGQGSFTVAQGASLGAQTVTLFGAAGNPVVIAGVVSATGTVRGSYTENLVVAGSGQMTVSLGLKNSFGGSIASGGVVSVGHFVTYGTLKVAGSLNAGSYFSEGFYQSGLKHGQALIVEAGGQISATSVGLLGTDTVMANGVVLASNSVFLPAKSLDVFGVVRAGTTLNGSGDLGFGTPAYWYKPQITVESGGTLAGAVLRLSSNYGKTLTVNGGGVVNLTSQFYANGKVTIGVQAGASLSIGPGTGGAGLLVDGSGTQTGTASIIAGAALSIGDSATIGNSGTAGVKLGYPSVAGGAPNLAIAGKLLLGAAAGGSGSLSIIGGTVTVGSGVTVGSAGYGLLAAGNIRGANGSVLANGDLAIGVGSTAKGVVKVAGTASRLTATNATLGGAAAGAVGAYGSLSVSTGATAKLAGSVTVGNAGTGSAYVGSGLPSLLQIGGGLYLGVAATGAGKVTVSTGGSVSVASGVTIGAAGRGSLTVRSGGTFTAGNGVDVRVATQPGAHGSIYVGGTASLLQVPGNLYVAGTTGPRYGSIWVRAGSLSVGGNVAIDAPTTAGYGRVTASDGGSITIGGNLIVYGGMAGLTVGSSNTLNGGAVEVDGTLVLAGGTIDVEPGSSLDLGQTGVAARTALTAAGTTGGAPGYLRIFSNEVLVGFGKLTVKGRTIPQSVFGSIINNGTLEATAGTITVDGNITGTGIVKIDTNSGLEVQGTAIGQGTIGQGQTITFPGDGTGTLILDNPIANSSTVGTNVFSVAGMTLAQGATTGDRIILKNAVPDTHHGVLNTTIGTLNGSPTLQVLFGSAADININGGAHTFAGVINMPAPSITPNQFLNAMRSSDDKTPDPNGSDTILTLTQGNPLVLAVNAQKASGTGDGIRIGIISDNQAEIDAMKKVIAAIAPDAISPDSYHVLTHDKTPAGLTAAFTQLQGKKLNVIVDDISESNGNIGLDFKDQRADLLEKMNELLSAGTILISSAGQAPQQPIVAGHAASPLEITVAAMNWLAAPAPSSGQQPAAGGYLTPAIEPFSGRKGGGSDTKFPDITAPDAGPSTLTMGAGGGPGTFNPFFGTSAAGPLVAGIVALMLQKNSQLEHQANGAALIKNALRRSAISASAIGLNGGAGLVQADQAVNNTPPPKAIVGGTHGAPAVSSAGPTVTTAFLSQAAGDANTGGVIQVTVNLSASVTVVGGVPVLNLNDGAAAAYNAASSDPASGALVFDYTVGLGDQTPNLAIAGFNPSGATITDTGGNAANFSALFNAPTGVSINSPLTATAVSASQSGELQAGQTVQLTVALNAAVTVNTAGGPPLLDLANGATASYDTVLSNPAAGSLVFDYTVGAAEVTPDLAVLDVVLPDGTTVQDGSGNNADFSAAQDKSTGLQIGPSFVFSVFAPPNGSADTGQTVQLTVLASTAVTVDTTGGAPSLTLNDGETALYDAAVSLPSSGALVFDYLVQSADQTPTLQGTSLIFNGARITDPNGVSVDFAGLVDYPMALSVNSPLRATQVTPSQTGQVAAGQTIHLTLSLNESLAVNSFGDLSDAPTLTLNDGATATYDAAASMPATGQLVFDYTVGVTDRTANLAITQVGVPGPLFTDSQGYLPDFSGILNIGTGVIVGARRPPADFDADGTSDVLWRNNSSGDTGYWRIASNTIAGWTGLGQSPITYNVVGVGDFNGDSTADVLWRDPSSGDTGYWTIANNAIAGWTDLGQSPTTYGVVGVGDFTGDGISDVLWRNNSSGDTGYWRISNNRIAGWTGLGQSPTTYNVAGVGDFTGGGMADVLWWNSATGDTGYWTIANNAIAGWTDLGQAPTTYNIVGVGDFTGDGIADVLWHNNATGDTGYWGIANNAITGWTGFGQAPTTYNVVGVGDFNGDGISDVLWRNPTTGDTGYWAIAHNMIAGWTDLGQAPTTYAVENGATSAGAEGNAAGPIRLGSSAQSSVGAANDTIIGGSGPAVINAIAGPESIVGGSGATAVFGGSGDTIIAGSGDTYIDGSAGGMTIKLGSAGSDNIIGSATGAGVTIKGGAASLDYNPGAGGDLIDLTGSSSGGVINGFGSDNGPVNDTVIAGSGATSVWGGQGDRIGVGTGATSSDLFTHATTIKSAAIGFGSNDSVVAASYGAAAAAVTVTGGIAGASSAQVMVSGFAELGGAPTDFIFYQNESAATNAAIVATSTEVAVEGVISTRFTLPDGTQMTLFGVARTDFNTAFFQP